MAMLITNLGQVKAKCSSDGWRLYCQENAIDPSNIDPKEEVAIDSLDMLRYGMDKDHTTIREDIKTLTAGQ